MKIGKYIAYKIRKRGGLGKLSVNDWIDVLLHPLFGSDFGEVALALDILLHTVKDKKVDADKIIKESLVPYLKRRRFK